MTEYADEFVWLAFFDADEFLRLEQDATVPEFLARFPQADAVAVNWCNYGSSSHYLKPKIPPVAAYTWHGKSSQPINRHVKCFVRPQKVGPDWRNVHCFDTAPERTLLANGAVAVWGETRGIIVGEPDWSVARLMHYQCRSMEHFLERLRKRPDVRIHENLWRGYDVHEVQDETPLRLLPALQARLAAMARGPDQHPVTDLIFDIGISEGNDTEFYLAKGFRVVGVEADAEVYYALCARFKAEIAAGRLVIHNAAAGARPGEIVEFFHHAQHQGLSGLQNSRAEFAPGSFRSYHVLTIDWATLTAKHGVPHYAKIDIEGAEGAFSSGAGGQPLPDFCSVECHTLAPVQALYELGYRWFKLVDQNPEGGFALPETQREGQSIVGQNFVHASGPFGRDLPGDWVDFGGFSALWQAARPLSHRTWFD